MARLGFIPPDQDFKWFACFEAPTLELYRSWTSFHAFRVYFEREGENWRASHADVSLDREYFSSPLEEAEEALLKVLEFLASGKGQEPYEDPFVTGLKVALQPGYLGDPKTVADVLAPFFGAVVGSRMCLHLHGVPEVSFQEAQDQATPLPEIFSGANPAYTIMPGWHTVDSLGAAVIRYFDLDADYLDGEDLYCILSEGFAGVSLRIGQNISAAAKLPCPNWNAVLGQIREMSAFVAAVLMGTNTVLMSGKTLKNLALGGAAVEEMLDDAEGEEDREEDESSDEPEPVPGPHLHPRPDDHWNPVKLTKPSTPTPLSAWHDPTTAATVLPDGPMPDEINGIAFRTWKDVPTTSAGWENVPGQIDDIDPVFHIGLGKEPATGVIIEESDGRVWIVHPSNAWGGYQATFPKGKHDDDELPLQANAIKDSVRGSRATGGNHRLPD